jgi:hypothetical protein
MTISVFERESVGADRLACELLGASVVKLLTRFERWLVPPGFEPLEAPFPKGCLLHFNANHSGNFQTFKG